MRAKATREEVAARAAACTQREGVGRIVNVEVSHSDGSVHSEWDVRCGYMLQTDGPGSELPFEQASVPANVGDWIGRSLNNSEKTKMASVENVAGREAAAGTGTKANNATNDGGAKADAKADKEAKAKAKAEAAAKAKAAKGPTKKETVLDLMKSTKGGVTLEDIQKKLTITAAAARALIGDCQRVEGVTVKREKVDGVSKYSA